MVLDPTYPVQRVGVQGDVSCAGPFAGHTEMHLALLSD